MTEWLTREEALERLKVRPQTLYAYVSRNRPRYQGRGRESARAQA
ncbi:MAG: citrate synthase, partial [Mesorhizobium sp.]